MTNAQKQAVLEMRNAGQSYNTIAEALGLPCGTVKSYISRCADTSSVTARLAVASASSDATCCRQCGKLLVLHSGNHMKRFCSENCRQKWWRNHKGELSAKASTSVCADCGAVFKNGGNPARRFCSRACYFNHRFHQEGVR